MFAPLFVIAVREVVPSMSTARLLSVFGCKHCHFSLNHEIFEFHRFNQVSVPNVATVCDADILDLLRELVQLVAAFFEIVLSPEHRCVSLHSLLHAASDHCSGGLA